ncbi:hypothetical protein [Nocardia sp. NRRL S-836]|uniref:hypothetical protein n=1 Tax=Nocardia sp. NRRL S-836 TaxID=1519492 RepID=UPI0018D15A82|nr:hypothetical protein [Nocardia sp. NRRL S-836]
MATHARSTMHTAAWSRAARRIVVQRVPGSAGQHFQVMPDNRTKAVIEEYKHGKVIVKIYYLNGTEMS